MLKEEQVATIYDWYKEGCSVRLIARHFNITETHVYNLVHGRVHKQWHRRYHPEQYGLQRRSFIGKR